MTKQILELLHQHAYNQLITKFFYLIAALKANTPIAKEFNFIQRFMCEIYKYLHEYIFYCIKAAWQAIPIEGYEATLPQCQQIDVNTQFKNRHHYEAMNEWLRQYFLNNLRSVDDDQSGKKSLTDIFIQSNALEFKTGKILCILIWKISQWKD